MTQLGLEWLVNSNPHLYRVPDYLPLRDYTRAAMHGDIQTATEIAASLQSVREVHAKWIRGYWHRGRLPMAEMKYWHELIGMNGGPIGPPQVEMIDAARTERRADLEATGLLERAHDGARVAAE